MSSFSITPSNCILSTVFALSLVAYGAEEAKSEQIAQIKPVANVSVNTESPKGAIVYSDDVTAKYWRLEGKSEEQIQARVAFLVDAIQARTYKERFSDLEMRDKYKNAIVIDALAVGLIGELPMGMSEEMYEGLNALAFNNGYTMMSTTVHTGSPSVGSYEQTVKSMKKTQAYQPLIARIQVRSLVDLYRAKVEGLDAYDFHIQGMSFIDHLDQLEERSLYVRA